MLSIRILPKFNRICYYSNWACCSRYSCDLYLYIAIQREHNSEKGFKKCTAVDKNKRYKNVDEIASEFERSKSGYYLQKLYMQLPGLRSDKWYCKLMAFVGYFVFFLYIFGITAMVIAEEKVTKSSCFLIATVLTFEWILPWAIAANIGNYDVRLLHLEKVPAPARVVIRIIFGILFFVFGVIIDAALA